MAIALTPDEWAVYRLIWNRRGFCVSELRESHPDLVRSYSGVMMTLNYKGVIAKKKGVPRKHCAVWIVRGITVSAPHGAPPLTAEVRKHSLLSGATHGEYAIDTVCRGSQSQTSLARVIHPIRVSWVLARSPIGRWGDHPIGILIMRSA